MTRRTFSGLLSLKGWRTPMYLWAQSAYWSVREWFAETERQPRKSAVRLEVDPLEIRQLPSFALSLFSDAVADPIQGATTQVGQATVGMQDGNASVNVPLDFFRSQDGFFRDDPNGPTALVYNSNTVSVEPVLQFQLTSAGGDPVPSSIQATLTFNGTADSQVTFSTTGHSAGDTYLLGLQHATAIASSGYYAWSVAVVVNITGQSPVNLSASGNTGLVVRDTSNDYLGRGWGLQGMDSIVSASGGVLYVYGSGGSRFFSGTPGMGGGDYTSPANDFGFLHKNFDGSYTYTDPQQNKINFDSNGRITTRVDPHGLTVTYTFDGGGKLTSIGAPDGGTATFTYDGNNLLQTVVQPGGRTVTFAHASNSDVTSLTDPDGGLRTFTYSTHKLTGEQFGNQRTTYTYDGTTGMLSSIDRGGSSTTNVTPVLSQGLATSPANNASTGVGVVSDPLSNKTTYTLDSAGRATKITAADGGVQQWALNAGGLPTTYTDQLGNVTSYTYNSGTADVTKIQYADGGVVTMAYDATFHKVTSSIDPLGNRTTFTYDATYGDLLTKKDALSGVTTYVWGDGGISGGLGGPPSNNTAYGLLVSVTDPLNHTTTYQYDSSTVNPPQRRLTTTVDVLNNYTTYTYDGAGHLLTVRYPFTGESQPGSGDTTYVYDTMERQVTSIDGVGRQTTYVYDALGNLTDTTDNLSRRTTYAYDVRGNVTGETDAVGTGDARSMAYTYNSADERITFTDARNNVTSYAYDAVGRQTTVTDPLGGVATAVYDLAGHVTAQIDQLGHATTYIYDAMGRRLTTRDALNNVTTNTYDLAGNLLSTKDPLNHVTSYAYDALNRRTREIDDNGGSLARTLTTTYDAVGNVTAVTNGRGDTTTFTYDAIYREVTRKDALGHVTTTAYYSDTQQVAQTIDALGNTTTRTYDKALQLISVNRPGGGAETYTYDAAGNLQTSVNELGKTTTYAYDNLNRLTVTTDALNGKTTYVYDASGNRTVVIDPDGNHTTTTYDALNRQTDVKDPLGHSATFAYDAASRLTSTTDRLGQRRDFSYDGVNQKLTEKWYSTTALFTQTQTFTWDANGNMLTAVDPDGSNVFTYDDLNRVSTVTEPFGLSMTYTYDAADNRTAIQDNMGGRETFTYDAAERMTNVKFTGNSATVSYDLSWTNRDQLSGVTRYSDITGTTKIGTTSLTYDAQGRTTNIWNKDGSGTSIQNTTYTYDTFDRLTNKQVDGSTTTYTYDDNNQLTNDGSAYTYDANGNRTMTGYTTGTGNQTTNDGTYTYTYDAEGNLTKKSKGAALETWNYGYDKQNHLVWVEKHATDGGTLQLRIDYQYDALGNRIQRTEDSNGDGNVDTTEKYGYDGANVWADLDGSYTLTYRRLYGVGVDTPVARISYGGTAVWYLTDSENSVTVMVDATGATIGKISYDGFGKIVSDTTGASGDRYKYTGREWDADAKLQYNRARYYDPALGKWTSVDPIGFESDDTDLYRYVSNNPTTLTDPSGLAYKTMVEFQFGNQPDPPPAGVTYNHSVDKSGRLAISEISVAYPGYSRGIPEGLGTITVKVWLKATGDTPMDQNLHRVRVTLDLVVNTWAAKNYWAFGEWKDSRGGILCWAASSDPEHTRQTVTEDLYARIGFQGSWTTLCTYTPEGVAMYGNIRVVGIAHVTATSP
jgi:RHS repeat-associated protein